MGKSECARTSLGRGASLLAFVGVVFATSVLATPHQTPITERDCTHDHTVNGVTYRVTWTCDGGPYCFCGSSGIVVNMNGEIIHSFTNCDGIGCV